MLSQERKEKNETQCNGLRAAFLSTFGVVGLWGSLSIRSLLLTVVEEDKNAHVPKAVTMTS